MNKQSTTEREDITFEDGYEQLKAIVGRLGEEEVPVHEMFEGLRRGKGLEKSLRAYLTDLEGELTEIEAGKGLPEFNIVAPSRGGAPPSGPVAERFFEQPPIDDADRQPAAPGRPTGDDEIPF
jgi:exonuclease VII small subunit